MITPPSTPQKLEDFLSSMREAGKKATSNFRPTENQFDKTAKDVKVKSWKDMSKDEQQQACTYQSTTFGITRLPGEKCRYQPRYCGHCEKCLQKQAKEREEKYQKARGKAQLNAPEGKWRKKTVDKDSVERDSHKKQIARKHDKMHMEVPSLEDDAKIDVWVWDDSEDDSMGEVANPDEIDWDAINRKCKDSGGRVTFGGGIRPPEEGPKENTKRMVIPEVVVHRRDMPKTVKIMNEVNLLEEAEDFNQVQNLLLRQFEMGINALKEAGVNIICINDQYRNLDIDKTVEKWNEFVRNSILESNIVEPRTDKDQLTPMQIFYHECIYPGTPL